MIERSGPPPEFISTTGVTYTGPATNVAYQSPPPPRPPTANGLADDDPIERIFATLDAMDGPTLRLFLRVLADRYPMHTP